MLHHHNAVKSFPRVSLWKTLTLIEASTVFLRDAQGTATRIHTKAAGSLLILGALTTHRSIPQYHLETRSLPGGFTSV